MILVHKGSPEIQVRRVHKGIKGQLAPPVLRGLPVRLAQQGRRVRKETLVQLG